MIPGQCRAMPIRTTVEIPDLAKDMGSGLSFLNRLPDLLFSILAFLTGMTTQHLLSSAVHCINAICIVSSVVLAGVSVSGAEVMFAHAMIYWLENLSPLICLGFICCGR